MERKALESGRVGLDAKSMLSLISVDEQNQLVVITPMHGSTPILEDAKAERISQLSLVVRRSSLR